MKWLPHLSPVKRFFLTLWIVLIVLSFLFVNDHYEVDAPYVKQAHLYQAIIIGGPIAVFLIYRWRKYFVEQKNKQKQNEQNKRTEAERLRLSIESHLSQLNNASLKSLDLFKALPDDLKQAEKAADRAVRDYKNHAYSPFWSEIESSYHYLNCYKIKVSAIRDLGNLYANHVESLRALGISELLPPFPIHLNSKEISRVLENASAQLSRMTYEAQRDATFAVIWEQRRTTTAVEIGFQTLESAVRQMAGALLGAIQGLEEQLNQVSRVIQVSARDSSDQNAILISQNSQILEASRHQIASQRKQNDSLREISRGVHFVEWGHHQIF